MTFYKYTQLGYGGVENCELCDEVRSVNEYVRSDGKASLICPQCARVLKIDKGLKSE